MAVILYELLVEVGKPKEMLKFIDDDRFWPGFDRFHLSLVYLDAFCTNDVTEELGGALVGRTLLSLEEKMVFPQLVEHYLNMVAMFGLVAGVYQDVISVDQKQNDGGTPRTGEKVQEIDTVLDDASPQWFSNCGLDEVLRLAGFLSELQLLAAVVSPTGHPKTSWK